MLCWQASHGKPDIGHEIALDLQAGNFAEARELLQRALKQSPKDARLWTFDGIALAQLKQPDAALKSFDRALALAPDYLPALEGAAQLEFQAGSARAPALLNQIVKLRPGDQTSHAMLAEIAFKQGDCETAKKESLLSAAPSEAQGLKEFGGCLVNRKRFVEALPVYQGLVELDSGSEKSLYSLAVVEFLAGRYSQVIQTLSQDSSDADTLELLGEAYEFTGQSEKAMDLIKRAIAISPEAPGYYTDFAYICLAHGKFQAGLDTVNQGLQKLPSAAPLYVARGLLYSELGHFDQGENDFRTASRLDPDVELGPEAQGLAELQQNDLPRAERTVRERLKVHPNNAFQYYLLAEILSKKGAADEALTSAENSVRLKPDLILARNLLARLYLQAGRTAESIEQSRVVYKANPTDQTALYHLILALRKGGKTEEIPALLQQLARLKEQDRSVKP